MISIIISSINDSYLNAVKENIADTIGVPFEVISFNNSNGFMGISEVYNKGIRLAKFDILCFMHEDVKVHTLNWGKVVANIFDQHKNVGLIGIAGSKYKSLAPSSWHCYDIDADELMYYNIIQNYKFKNKKAVKDYSNVTNEKLTNVVCIDGVWMCCKRDAVNIYQFDDKLLTKFHGYDIDFSLGVGQNFDVVVTFEVLIEHFSEGNFNKEWLKEILKVHSKWSKFLPIKIPEGNDNLFLKGEIKGFKTIFKKMWREGFRIKDMYNVISSSEKSRIMNFRFRIKLLGKLFKYFFKRRSFS